MEGDHFDFADGTPVKFWASISPMARLRQERSRVYRRALRQVWRQRRAHAQVHRRRGEGIGDQRRHHDDPDGPGPPGLLRQPAREATASTMAGRTPTLPVRPGDRPAAGLRRTEENERPHTYAVINYAEDVQDLMIEMVVNLLKHKNPYTGKTYAQDPALCLHRVAERRRHLLLHHRAAPTTSFPPTSKTC